MDSPLSSSLSGPDIDVVVPFQIERSAVRGRMVRLGPALDHILKRHDYPAPVAYVLAELTVLAVILAKALKYEGIFTLQTKGDGAVKMMVADVTSAGAIRAYAQFDAAAVTEATRQLTGIPTLQVLCGQGYLAFTVDQGADTERYQGIVALEGDRPIDAVRHYFAQSEQLAADFAVAVAQNFGSDGSHQWIAGGIMIQRLPADDSATPSAPPMAENDESWRRAAIFLQSVRPAELADPALTPTELLFRLFHEDGVRVFTRQILEDKCRCSRDRVDVVLQSLSPEERADLAIDGILSVTCEFCNRAYQFSAGDFPLS